jgi:regulator of replication initiation timing
MNIFKRILTAANRRHATRKQMLELIDERARLIVENTRLRIEQCKLWEVNEELARKLQSKTDAEDMWSANWQQKVATLAKSLSDAHKQIDEADELRVMQLAAISTASIQNTITAVSERIPRANDFWTGAYQDTCIAVDREMRERRRAEKAEAVIDEARSILRAGLDCKFTDDVSLRVLACVAINSLTAAGDPKINPEWAALGAEANITTLPDPDCICYACEDLRRNP